MCLKILSPSQPFFGSPRNAPLHERCVTTPKTAAYYFHMALDEFLIRDHFNRTKIQTPNCSKFLVNRAKILNFPV